MGMRWGSAFQYGVGKILVGNRPGSAAWSQIVCGLEDPHKGGLCLIGNGESSQVFVYDPYFLWEDY